MGSVTSDSNSGDWTSGAPKWAAVAVLGAASVAALAYSVARDARPWRVVPPAAMQPGSSAASARPTLDAAAYLATSKPPAPSPIRRTVNINSASAAELELLPGVGPELAQRIFEHRSRYGAFKRVDDLDAVRGIGPRLLERVRPFASVE